MSNMKKTANSGHVADKQFPPEAYEYNDDVTKEAVERVREQAASFIDPRKWEVIDGFGRPSR